MIRRRGSMAASAAIAAWFFSSTVDALGDGGTSTGCAVCPDGSSVPYARHPAGYSKDDSLTCGELEEMAAGMESPTQDECARIAYIGIANCHCPYDMSYFQEHVANFTCSLCIDGSPVPDPDAFFDPTDGLTCADAEAAAAAMLSEDPLTCREFQATAGAVCGCAHPPQPSCNPCDKDEKILFAALTMVDSDGVLVPQECAETIFELSLEESLCQEVKGSIEDDCCKRENRGSKMGGKKLKGEKKMKGKKGKTEKGKKQKKEKDSKKSKKSKSEKDSSDSKSKKSKSEKGSKGKKKEKDSDDYKGKHMKGALKHVVKKLKKAETKKKRSDSIIKAKAMKKGARMKARHGKYYYH